MKSNKPDTFLLGHARRMRACRMRQRQQDSEGYKQRVKRQRREHRLRARSKFVNKQRTKPPHNSTVNKRTLDRERKRRSRHKQSNDKIAAQRQFDRNYRSQRREAAKLSDRLRNARDDGYRITFDANNKLQSITPCFYTVSIQLNS